MYRIIGADGKPYGPVSAEQLRQWVQEGRANAKTQVLAEGTTEWKPLAEFPEFEPPSGAAVPPGVPPALSALPGAASPALDAVRGPAIGLIILGALNLALSLLRAALMLAGLGTASMFPSGNTELDKTIMYFAGTFGLAFSLIGVIGGAFILYGGIKMRKLESHGLAMAASVVAMIPCVSLCCPIGIAIGIWSLIALNKPEVKASFH